jgi:hypothetical protein
MQLLRQGLARGQAAVQVEDFHQVDDRPAPIELFLLPRSKSGQYGFYIDMLRFASRSCRRGRRRRRSGRRAEGLEGTDALQGADAPSMDLEGALSRRQRRLTVRAISPSMTGFLARAILHRAEVLLNLEVVQPDEVLELRASSQH